MCGFISLEKRELLHNRLKELEVDVVFHNHVESNPDRNVHYLTGYPEWGVLTYASSGEHVLAAYDVQIAEKFARKSTIVWKRDWLKDSGLQMCKDIEKLAGKPDPTIGVLSILSLGDYNLLRKWLKKHLPKAKLYKESRKMDAIYNDLRKTKTPHELKLLKASCKIASDTVSLIGDYILKHPKAKERDVAVFIDSSMLSRGGEGPAFETIVASPKRSWQIHTYPRAGGEVLKQKGLGLTDFGTKVGGFCSDVTVPFVFGKPTHKQELIRDTVIEAAQAALDSISIGVPIWEISKAATDVIEGAGFVLPHSLGHGIGLEVHDLPVIAPKPRDPDVLKNWKPELIEENMVFTVEPGIYDATHGGFRFENDVLVTKTKPKLLTHSEVLCFPTL